MPHEPAQSMEGPEIVTGYAPFTVRRTTRWHECDPAGVVYAGNFTDYLLSAADLFKQHLATAGRDTQPASGTFQAPGKALSLIYLSPLWPNDVFDTKVYIGEVRRHTIDVLASATRADNGKPVFIGRITSIYVSPQDRLEAMAIPDDARAAFERYRAANPASERLVAEVGR